MATQAQELNKLSDEQVEKELKDLQGKTEVTPEEKEKLSNLKEERQSRLQLKIDKLSSKEKAAEYKAQQLEKQLEEERRKREELEKDRRVESKPRIVEETVEYGNKKYYTDESLTSMVANQELTPQKAYQHQPMRDKAEILAEIEAKNQEKQFKSEDERTRKEDYEAMLRDYPQFAPNHPSHDPEEPLYKTANELWLEGLRANPRGLTLAIKRAKQILRQNDQPDVSEHLNVGKSRSASPSREAEREVQLTPVEENAATRMYGGIINPATGRNYTDAEAISKAIKAKTARARG